MYEATLIGIEVLVMIPGIFVIGFILWWFKHDKEAFLQGKQNTRKINVIVWSAITALIILWVVYIEIQAHDSSRISGNTETGQIIEESFF